jgi:hypothetical protein
MGLYLPSLPDSNSLAHICLLWRFAFPFFTTIFTLASNHWYIQEQGLLSSRSTQNHEIYIRAHFRRFTVALATQNVPRGQGHRRDHPLPLTRSEDYSLGMRPLRFQHHHVPHPQRTFHLHSLRSPTRTRFQRSTSAKVRDMLYPAPFIRVKGP